MQCSVSVKSLLLLARVQKYFRHSGEGDKWALFSWLMCIGISRHGSRDRKEKMMKEMMMAQEVKSIAAPCAHQPGGLLQVSLLASV